MTEEESARFDAIERRLAALEAQITRLSPLTHPAIPPAKPDTSPAPAPTLPPRVPATNPAETTNAERPRRPDIETAVGLTWLSRIAVLTIVLALAFFFKYAFERHWITEWGRVLLGAGAAAVALFFGERFWRVGQRTYGQALTAAGIVFLYLSCWAAFGLYRLISQPATFTAMILSTAVAGLLAFRYDSPAIAVLGLAGGFATPLLLGAGRAPWLVLGYALILDLGAAFASRQRGWRWPEGLAVAGTIVLYISQLPVPEDSRPVYTIFVVAFYILFAASDLPGVFLPPQLLAGIAVVRIWQEAASALFAALLIAAAGLVVTGNRRWPTALTGCFVGFWLAYGLWSAGWAPPFFAGFPLVTATFGVFLGWTLWRAAVLREQLRLEDLVILALNAGVYFGVAYNQLVGAGYHAWDGIFAVVLAAIQMAAARLLWPHDQRAGILAAAAAWVLLVLAVPIQFAGYRITIVWALEGAAIAWIGVRLGDARAVNAALAVFVLVFARLLFLDTWMFPNPAAYPMLINARFLTFAVSALCLGATAFWIRGGRRALAAYLGGLLVMLWGLCLEAAGWAGRTSAPPDVRSVTSLSISVVVAAYAVLLVAGGVARRSAITRIAGITLIGIVVLKLYLYDVWLLAQFYRMAAFAILGLLLLTMSYLYSRFRDSIEGWWRPGSPGS